MHTFNVYSSYFVRGSDCEIDQMIGFNKDNVDGQRGLIDFTTDDDGVSPSPREWNFFFFFVFDHIERGNKLFDLEWRSSRRGIIRVILTFLASKVGIGLITFKVNSVCEFDSKHDCERLPLIDRWSSGVFSKFIARLVSLVECRTCRSFKNVCIASCSCCSSSSSWL